MVARNDQRVRMYDLWRIVDSYVADGKRSVEEVAHVLQIIKDRKDFAAHLLSPKASVPVVTTPSVRRLLRSWSKFYHRYFGIQPDGNSTFSTEHKKAYDDIRGVLANLDTPEDVAQALGGA